MKILSTLCLISTATYGVSGPIWSPAVTDASPMEAANHSAEIVNFAGWLAGRSPYEGLVAILPGQNRPLRLSFANVAVANVLAAISRATGANVVLGSQTEAKVTMNVTVHSAEEALRATAAASGLSYAKAGSTYVVAAAADLRQALVPYGSRLVHPVPPGTAVDVATAVQEKFPLATVTAQSEHVLFIGQPAEFDAASKMIKAASEIAAANRPISDTILLTSAAPQDVEKMLTQVFPNLKVASEAPSGNKKAGGVIVVTGRTLEVQEAKRMATEVDEGTSASSSTVFTVYELKYTSAPSAVEFLKAAAPDVEVIPGPETYIPPTGDFSPLGTALRSAAGTGTSGGSGGIGGGTTQGTSGTGETGTGSQSSQTVLEPGARSTAVVIRGTRSAVDLAERLLSTLDVKPVQISVEARVVEMSKDFGKSLGIDYNWTTMRFFERPAGSVIPGTGLVFDADRTRPAGLGQFSRAPFGIEGVINAMVTKGDAKILANPNVRVINNQDAYIFIGDTIRTRVAQANGLGGQTIQIVEFPVGIILLIRPRMNADGNIAMHVHPVVSTVTAVDADSIPQTSSREAETNVMVKNGETIVIAGLIREEYSKMITAVPILSKIPIIGELFKSRSTNKNRSEVVVTITPRIVTEVTDDPKEGKDDQGGK